MHAKVLIVDDWLLRVGSSNLNNRSLGFDTECDLIVEADRSDDPADIRGTIARIRDDLLAEHLGRTADDVAAALAAADGRLSTAVDSLLSKGRTLVPYEPEDVAFYEEPFAENELLDPERPPTLRRWLARRFSLRPSPVR